MLFTAIFSACGDLDLSNVSDEDLDRVSDKLVECNKPYIRFGTTCCLDENENNICDEDDRKKEQKELEDEYFDEEFLDEEPYYEDDEFDLIFGDYEGEGDEDDRVYVEAELEGEKVLLEWEADISKEDFKYYKVMHSTDNDDPKYPQDSAVGVIDDYEETKFYIQKGLSRLYLDDKQKPEKFTLEDALRMMS